MSAYKDRNKKGQLWMAFRFSALSFEALSVEEGSGPFIVEQKQKVFFASPAAVDKGVNPGMDVITAQVLSACVVHSRNSEAELQFLQDVSEGFYQYSPYIEVEHSEFGGGILIEVSRCLKLFNGVQELKRHTDDFLQSKCISFSFGLAHTAKGAWLLTWDDYPVDGNDGASTFFERLKNVPLSRIKAFPKSTTTLSKSGFVYLGDLVKQVEKGSISSFKRRLNADFTDYLCGIFDSDQSFEQASLFEAPRKVFTPKDIYNDVSQLEYPIAQVDLLKPVVHLMLQRFSDYLKVRQLECQNIQWQLFDIYHNQDVIDVVCDLPQNQVDLLYELTCLKLEHWSLAFEVDCVELQCEHMMIVEGRDQGLGFEGPNTLAIQQGFSLTLAKLHILLGEQAVFKVSYSDSHVPEESSVAVAPAAVCNQFLPNLQRIALRPTWIFSTPEVIVKRSRGLFWQGYMRLLSKPERIESRWWNEPVCRDYYMAQREDGARFWVFVNLHDESWHVHGVFS